MSDDDLEDEVYGLLAKVSAGVAMREAAYYLTIAINLLRAAGVDVTPLRQWAVALADASYALDPTFTRVPKEARWPEHDDPAN